MQIPVVTEPTESGGYRAQSMPPLTAAALGKTRDEAIEKLREEISKELARGVQIVMVDIGGNSGQREIEDPPDDEADESADAGIDFKLGALYTRQQINEVLGGSVRGFLPFVNGKVVCGCFDPSDSMNPRAPEEVLFGEPYDTPVIDQTADMVFEQGREGVAIPVFLKRSTNEWEYVGKYLCIGITRDSRIVERKRIQNPQRRAFSGVLRFERVE